MRKKEIKEIVKGEYRQAALHVKSGGSSCCSMVSPSNKLDPITSRLYGSEETLICIRVKPSWIWDRAVESMSCSQPNASARLERSMASI